MSPSYTCPVCAWSNMPDAPQDYEICACCGTEFGNDDWDTSHEELRQIWVDEGCKFFDMDCIPDNWSVEIAKAQLKVLDFRIEYVE